MSTRLRLHTNAAPTLSAPLGDTGRRHRLYADGAWPGGGGSLSAGLAASTTQRFAFYSDALARTTWAAGRYLAEVEVTAVGTNCSAQLALHRAASTGASVEVLGTSALRTEAGVLALDLTLAARAVQTTDRLCLVVTCARGAGGGGTRAVSFDAAGLSAVDAALDLDSTPPTPPAGVQAQVFDFTP